MFPDLLIVGGGVIGLSIADVALRAGLRVRVLDKSAPARESSWAGAGMITCRPRPRHRAGVPDYHDLTLLSAEQYPLWSERLKAETGIDIGYRVSGALELLTASESEAEFDESAQSFLKGGAERGIAVRRLSRDETLAREPSLDAQAIAGALEFPNEAQIRTPWLTRALIASIEKRGGVIDSGISVADVALDPGSAKAVGALLNSGERIEAGNTVFAAGAWSGGFPELCRLAPMLAKVHPVRGQMLCYNTDAKLASRLLTCGPHYLVPRGDGVLLAGATHEHAGFDNVTTPEGFAELTAFSHSVLPALKTLEPVNRWAGLRPGLTGRHPLIGPVRGAKNLFVACGHYRNGLTLAPATAELLVDVIIGRTPKVAIDGWTP